jgi:SAM-dependent methyltransferase
MRPQDWAFFGATALALFTVTATVQGWVLGALAGLALTAILGWASHALSRRYPGPMPHIFRWGLLWPRGFHSPRRLRAILEPRSGERILELGPGVGVHALPVATSLAPSGTLDVLDVQQPMLDHLARRAARACVVNIVAKTGDGQRLPYASATFDGAYLIDTIGEMSDPAAVLRELRRTLKSGGRLVVGEHFLDPDFVSLRLLKSRAEAAGFTFERRSGTALIYLARFRTPSS